MEPFSLSFRGDFGSFAIDNVSGGFYALSQSIETGEFYPQVDSNGDDIERITGWPSTSPPLSSSVGKLCISFPHPHSCPRRVVPVFQHGRP